MLINNSSSFSGGEGGWSDLLKMGSFLSAHCLLEVMVFPKFPFLFYSILQLLFSLRKLIFPKEAEFTMWLKAFQKWCSDGSALSSELGWNGDPALSKRRNSFYTCNLGGNRKEHFDDFPPQLEESDGKYLWSKVWVVDRRLKCGTPVPQPRISVCLFPPSFQSPANWAFINT